MRKKDELWEEYLRTRNYKVRNELIEIYSYIPQIIAKKFSNICDGMLSLTYEDLLGYGYLGLIDAISKFKKDENKKFETYAYLRVKGEVIDGIRKSDWVSRAKRVRDKKDGIYTNVISTEIFVDANGDNFFENLYWYTINIDRHLILEESINNLLNKKEKIIVYYKYIKDVEDKKIAQILNLRVGSIYSIRKSALRKINNYLKDGPKGSFFI